MTLSKPSRPARMAPVVQPLADGCPVHEVHGVPRSGDEAVQRHQEVEEHLPCCGLWLGVSHDRFLLIWF
jgi:hypothetical protein